MKYKICKCGRKILGREHPKYAPNGILKQEFLCEVCFVKNGRQAPISIAKLLKQV